VFTAWSGSNGSVERGAGQSPFIFFQEYVMLHVMKILCGRVWPIEWYLVEKRSFHVGTGEIRSSHIGMAEIGPLQIGAAEFRLTQVRSVQACFLEMRIAQIGAPQIGMAQVRGSQVCSS